MKPLRIGLIGYGFMGRAHSNAYRKVGNFFDLEYQPVLKAICARNADNAAAFAKKWGYESIETDWRKLVARDDIEAIDICTPNNSHAEIAIAAAKAGKMILCEKPLAMDTAEGEEMCQAVEKAGVANIVWYNYRRIPAVGDIRARVAAGELGDPVQITVFYQCDYAADPLLPHSWRYEFERAGPGALLDVGTHAVDLSRFILGDVAEVTGAVSSISIPERFLPAEATVGHGHVALSEKTAKVENDDVTSALLRFANGAQGFVTASRVAVGTGNGDPSLKIHQR